MDSIDLQKTEAGPVHLRLLARKSFKTRHRLPMLFNAQGRDEPFHQIIAPFVALGLDVLEQPLGREILGFELGSDSPCMDPARKALAFYLERVPESEERGERSFGRLPSVWRWLRS